MKYHRFSPSLAAATLLLAACGGGGGSTTTITTSVPTAPPVANSAPTLFSANANQTAQVGAAFSYDATQSGSTFRDADGDVLTYTVSFSSNTPGLTSNGGTISGTPSQTGTVTMTITADDGRGGQVSDRFEIVISSPPAMPSGKPNIIFILSDDQGKDSSAEYSAATDVPNTPILTALANTGVIFENAWVAPSCSPTRAALLTGKHAARTTVFQPGDELPNTETILPAFLKANAATSEYSSAMIGKWHLGGGTSGPNDFGIDYFAGILSGSLSDYFDWDLTINGVSSTETNYATSELTDLAVDWVEDQTTPWFLWLSYNAPHKPYHLPPSDLHSRNLSGTQADIAANPRNYFLAAIEAMDTEFGRLWNSLEAQEQANTIVIYLGDNGTPRDAVSTTAQQNGNKGGLLQGGINTPFFMSGAGITRSGEREEALISHTDIFPTIAELAGADLSSFNDGQSFADILSDPNADAREFVFTEHSDGFAVRNTQFKLIENSNGSRELYDLQADPTEQTDLLNTGMNVSAIIAELEQEIDRIRDVSNITGLKFSDITPNCENYIGQYTANAKDVLLDVEFEASLETQTTGNTCTLSSNSIPNHDFNDGESSFANAVGVVAKTYSFPTNPTLAMTKTPLDQINNAVLLNGVKVDILSAGCFGVGDERTGCNDPTAPWRFDPMHAANGFQVDKSNAHAQPNGGYHYHGPPPVANGDAGTVSGVIGYAADGFPIYGPYFEDNGVIRTAESSFRLRSGTRPSGPNDPGGTYDGQFRADYEYVSGFGDLDECNGMTVDGQYRYHVTDAFPYVISCFSGTPDQSFNK